MSRLTEALDRIEAAMRSSLTEAMMSAEQARSVFAKYGQSVAPGDEAGLKAAYRALVMKYHPDRPNTGNEEAFKLIGNAYAALKDGGSTAGHAPHQSSQAREPEGTSPVWSKAGYAGGMRNNSAIRRQDYSDLNFCKKRLWELSGESREEWSLELWDGHFFRSGFTAYASADIFDDMADALLGWQDKFYKRKAVFAHRRNSKVLYLIWLDGDYVHPAMTIEHDSFNMNPSNDQQFCRMLPEWLEQVAAKHSAARTPLNIK